MAKAKDRVMVVDDQQPLRELIGEILQESGYAVEPVGDGQDAVARITNKDPIVVQGKIHWSQEGSLGVQFEEMSESAQARLDELAALDAARG